MIEQHLLGDDGQQNAMIFSIGVLQAERTSCTFVLGRRIFPPPQIQSYKSNQGEWRKRTQCYPQQGDVIIIDVIVQRTRHYQRIDPRNHQWYRSKHCTSWIGLEFPLTAIAHTLFRLLLLLLLVLHTRPIELVSPATIIIPMTLSPPLLPQQRTTRLCECRWTVRVEDLLVVALWYTMW